MIHHNVDFAFYNINGHYDGGFYAESVYFAKDHNMMVISGYEFSHTNLVLNDLINKIENGICSLLIRGLENDEYYYSKFKSIKYIDPKMIVMYVETKGKYAK